MDYERKKELLTKENIKTDLKGLLYHDVFLIFPWVLSLLFLYIVLNLIWSHFSISTASLNCIFIGIIIAVLIHSIILIKWIVIVKQNKFLVMTDKLTEAIYGRPSFTGMLPYKPHILRFMSHGKYGIPAKKNYKWSQLYAMSAQEVLNSSHVGDVFVLVLLGNKKIALAYNTRLFELVE